MTASWNAGRIVRIALFAPIRADAVGEENDIGVGLAVDP